VITLSIESRCLRGGTHDRHTSHHLVRVGLFALPIFAVLTAWQPSAHSLMPPSTLKDGPASSADIHRGHPCTART